MEDHSKKNFQDIITKLTHPVSIKGRNQSINKHTGVQTRIEPRADNYLTILNSESRNDDNMVLYEDFQLEEVKDSCTQTSKTIIQLAKLERGGDISPDSLSASPKSNDYQDEAVEVNFDQSYNSIADSEYTVYSKESAYSNEDFQTGNPVEPLQLNLTETESSRSPSLIETFLRKNKTKPGKDYAKYLPKKSLKSQSCVDTYSLYDVSYSHYTKFTVTNPENSGDNEKSFMMPTLSSTNKNLLPEIRQTSSLLSPIRRGRSSSPVMRVEVKTKEAKIKIPYIDQSESDFSCRKEPANIQKKTNLIPRVTLANRQATTKKITTPSPPKTFSQDMLKIDEMSLILVPTENNSTTYLTDPSTINENTVSACLARLQHTEWNVALKGLAEITELCKTTEAMIMMPHMVTINQRLIELLKSPRSHVCRTACQAAGHLFESMKDTRGPEFNDIVDILLAKTADANKFIRKDANLALDCMVTHVPTSHAIKALCAKGPTHKNNLVRTATVRLLICAVVIAGPNAVLNPNNNEATRKRIFTNLVRFLEDKNPDTRKYGERLYKVLSKERYFDRYIKKYIDRDDLTKMKRALKALSIK